MKRLQYIVLCGLLLLVAACEKDTLPMNFSPALTTGAASDIFRVGATLSGSIQKTDGVVVKDCGILISELQSMAEYTEIKTASTENSFNVLAQDLEPGKKYYYCAYASSGYSIARGEIKEFTTTDSNAPVFSELAVENKDEKSFTVATTILDEGGSDLMLCGFCWRLAESSSADPTVEDNVSNVSAQSSAISARIKDLTPNKNYLVRAYGINARGVGYGKTVAVSTNNATVPAVSSITPVDSTALSVSVKASILSAGESTVTEIGFCWSAESQEPTTANYKYDATGQGQAAFAYSIEGLALETTYYIRAYAVNGQGTGYGDVFKFTTGKPTEPGIYSLQDLIAYRDAKNAGSATVEWTVDGVVNIYADIDLNSVENWKPITTISVNEVLNGNGHTLSGLKMTCSPDNDYGFIMYNDGTIQDLHLGSGDVNIIIADNTALHFGTLCGLNRGLISNCSSAVTVKAERTNADIFNSFYVSGICGFNYLPGRIVRCVNRGNITGGWHACGIAGNNYGEVEMCENYGTISALDFNQAVFGIAGCWEEGKILNCTNFGTIKGGTADFTGGICSGIYGRIQGCVNEGTVSGSGSSVGGITGDLYGNGILQNSHNKGVVTGTDNTYTGGIVGHIKNACTYDLNQNNGTVNGAAGSDDNAIGKDDRNATTDTPSIDDLSTHEW